MKLHIDIETYSSVDLRTSGVYKYVSSFDFEILMIAYALDDDPVKVIDLASGEAISDEFLKYFYNPNIKKCAHNAAFERICFNESNLRSPIDQWECTLIKAAYAGLPLSLGQVAKVLKLENQKDKRGDALIKLFSIPVKATKVNGMKTRYYPEDKPEEWQEYLSYCAQDVETERDIDKVLPDLPAFERILYVIDQEINDAGIKVDTVLAQACIDINQENSKSLKDQMIAITGVENPNSPKQLKDWLQESTGEVIESLAKENVETFIEKFDGPVRDLLELRLRASKSSIKKYLAMMNCAGDDDRARGLFQFYGANRTGRWAGRLIQMQNLPRIYLNTKELEQARGIIRTGDFELTNMIYDQVSWTLSQLIRTTFVAEEGYRFVAADFSAIEARVIAWLAGEEWRLDVFRTHGKIYEASASMMFGVPMDKIGKGSDLRQKGKVAELALGYQGSVGAMMQMGADKMGLTEGEIKGIVDKWRMKSPKIKKFWDLCNRASILAVKKRTPQKLPGIPITFDYEEGNMTILLPSGKKLYYREAEITINQFDKPAVRYKGVDQRTRNWWWIETYGGKLVENIVQAVARDLLGDTMIRLRAEGVRMVLHVHDEVVAEVPKKAAMETLHLMCEIMGDPPPWAEGLPLKGEGYISDYYKKD